MARLSPSLGLATAALAAAVLAGPALAQDASGRYSIAPSDTGFVRMDTQTGKASHCAKRGDTWFCEPIAEVGAHLEHKVDTLSAALQALDREVDDLAAAFDQHKREKAVAKRRFGTRAAEFADTAVDRFVGMMRRLKHGS